MAISLKLSAILTAFSQEEHEWQYWEDTTSWSLFLSQGCFGTALIFRAEYQRAGRDTPLSYKNPRSDPAQQLPWVLIMKLVSRNYQKKLPIHLSCCILTCIQLYFWGSGQPWLTGPLAILNYTRAKDIVNQAGNFKATFGHKDHQSFIPISHNWNPAQKSAVLSKIPSLTASFPQISTSPVIK